LTPGRERPLIDLYRRLANEWNSYVLGPLLEEHLRRAFLLARGDPTLFFTRPISLAFMIGTALVLAAMIAPALRGKKPA